MRIYKCYNLISIVIIYSMLCTGCQDKKHINNQVIDSNSDIEKITLQNDNELNIKETNVEVNNSNNKKITLQNDNELDIKETNVEINNADNKKIYNVLEAKYSSYNSAYYNFLYKGLNKLNDDYEDIITFHSYSLDQGPFYDDLGYKDKPIEVFFIKKDDKWGLLDLEGNYIVEPVWEYFIIDQEGLANVIKDNLFGVVNYKGELIIDYKYKNILRFFNGLAIVYIDSDCDVDLNGNEFFYKDKYKTEDVDYIEEIKFSNSSPKYSYYYPLKAGLENKLYVVSKNNKKALMNSDGEYITDFIYDYIETISHSKEVIIFNKDDKVGLFNNKGEVVFEGASGIFRNELRTLTEDGELTYLYNNENKLIILSPGGRVINVQGWEDMDYYGYVKEYPEEVSLIQEGELVIDLPLYHFYDDSDHDGNIYTPATNLGYLIVEINDNLAVINLTEEKVIKENIEDYEFFTNYRMLVKENNNWILIDNNGSLIFDFNSNDVNIIKQNNPNNERNVINEDYILLETGEDIYLFNRKNSYMKKINNKFSNNEEKNIEIKQINEDTVYLVVRTNDKEILTDTYGNTLFETENKIYDIATGSILILEDSSEKKYIYDMESNYTMNNAESTEYFDDISFVEDDIFVIKLNDKYGVIRYY